MTLAAALLAVAALGAGCGNNLAALYKFRRGGGGGGPTDATGVVVVESLGKLVDGRPKVEAAFPSSGGWPATVPIVVQFNESMAEDSISPPPSGQGQPPAPRIFVRAEGTTQNLPAQIDLLMGGTVVLLRPSAGLPSATTFEVVVTNEVTDLDGIAKGGAAEQVVTTFRADQDSAFADGRIVTVLPLANAREVVRETGIYAIFDKPAVASTVTASNFVIADASGNLPGVIDQPVETQNVADPRIFRLVPRNPLAGGAEIEIRFDATIQFGTTPGELDFDNRTPFAKFSTVEFARPVSVALGNASVGFPNRVNRQNLAGATVDVQVDASATAGSRVLLRVYGLEKRTQAAGDLTWFDTALDLAVAGPTTVSLPIGEALGTADALRFEEGSLFFAARVASGRRGSAFTFAADASPAALDVTPPSVAAFLPAVAGASTDIATDQEALALFGLASEPLGAAELTDGSATVALHAAGDDKSFTLRPLAVARTDLPINVVLNVTDRSGHLNTAPTNGRILRRGYASGVLAGSVSVEVYDEATLAPLAGATVVLEPGLPQNPPSPSRRVGTTDQNGRVRFDGVVDPSHSVTVVAANHHLISVLDTSAALLSLPVRPLGPAAVATVEGSLLFVPLTGQTARVGVNVLDDPFAFEVAPAQSAPTRIPSTAIRAGRPVVFSAFTANYEPTATPAFAGFACALAGNTGTGAAPASPPQVAGGKLSTSLTILPGTGITAGVAAPFNLDFAAAAGFGAISGNVRVRSILTFPGFAGGSLAGVGIGTPISATQFAINSNWPLSCIVALGPLNPALWVQADATDADGNTSLHRSLVTNATLGTVFVTGAPLGPPTITAPGGPVLGPPAVEFQDRLDAAVIPGGLGFHTVSIEDASGLRWTLIAQDLDGASGPETLQIPVLSGVASSLAAGEWKLRIASELMFGIGGAGEFSLEERHRQLVKASRTPITTFVVQ
ncbi:MAG: Ig-like domain-containing protein [Planctomycetes bacterium]|nr:Ig-like domain-containing protein [Planctomycetota bacterium]